MGIDKADYFEGFMAVYVPKSLTDLIIFRMNYRIQEGYAAC